MTVIHHTLVCGATRSGKSEAELSRLVPLAKAGDCAVVLLDPPGTLARKLLLHLDLHGQTRRVLYDRLSDTDRVPGYDWLVRSNHPDPLQREAENDERIREFAAVLLRRRGILDPSGTPIIEEGLLAALRLYLYQDCPSPLPWLADVFDARSPARAHLLGHCTQPDLIRKFHEYASLSPLAKRTETGPAERILRAVLGSPAFRVRCGDATVDIGRLLDDGGILILDGGSQGNLSRDAASVMMGAVILRVIQHSRVGAKRRIVLVLDEAVNANLIGLYESQALAEAGKWGLEFHVLVQDPFGFSTAEIRSNVLQNCWRHEWFRQGSSEAAKLAAEDVATPLFDPLRVHHVEERVRTKDVGFERITTEGRSESLDSSGRRVKSTSWHTVLWPRRKEVKDRQERFTALTDQTRLVQKELMRLQTGYRFVRDDAVTPAAEYVPMLPSPWAGSDDFRIGRSGDLLAETKFQLNLRAMKDRGSYRKPAAFVPPTPKAAGGAAARLSRKAQSLPAS